MSSSDRDTNEASSGVRRKFSWGGLPVAYGCQLYLVCALCDVTI